jgi:HAD superfamily hydrolase (TIGR01457 family)
MGNLRDKKLFLLDMDGTIYLDYELFDGTLEFLDYVKKIGGRYIFITNNSSRSVGAYVEKLARIGIAASKEDFLTSTQATVLYLKKNHSDKKLYAFGTQTFREELAEGGLNITDRLEDDIDALVMGFDTELTFQKLEDACILLGRGVDYIATNPDWVCPTWYGFVPDCGSISQILKTATGRMPRFIGKPQPEMILLAMEKTGFSKEETMVIGDRLYTDVASGKNAGVTGVLVLSGETKLEAVRDSETQPDYIFSDIRELLGVVSGKLEENIGRMRLPSKPCDM